MGVTLVNNSTVFCSSNQYPMQISLFYMLGTMARKETLGFMFTETIRLRLIRDGEVGGSGILYLTPDRYTVTTRMIY